VALSAADAAPALDPILARFPGATFLVFGFGDQHYLMSAHRGLPDLLGALWPGGGLVLVTGLRSPPGAAFGEPNVRAILLDADGLGRARDFISASMRRSGYAPALDESPRSGSPPSEPGLSGPQPYAPGPYPGSLYFLATARYSALYTCNTWVADVLASAELPVRSRGIVFAWQVWQQVRGLAASGGEVNDRAAPIRPDILHARPAGQSP
jgi:hypothetical protein